MSTARTTRRWRWAFLPPPEAASADGSSGRAGESYPLAPAAGLGVGSGKLTSGGLRRHQEQPRGAFLTHRPTRTSADRLLGRRLATLAVRRFVLPRLEEAHLVRCGIENCDFLPDPPRFDPRVHERVVLAVQIPMKCRDVIHLDHDRCPRCPAPRVG